jgi:hypothetical protein
VSDKAAWRRFVKQRRAELHGEYPCAAASRRLVCPKHGIPVPQETVFRGRDPWTGRTYTKRIPLSGICKRCFDEFYARISREYTAAARRQKGAA